jgi:hypothetical protein
MSCVICLNDLHDHEKGVTFLRCAHSLGTSCYEEYRKYFNKCPMCKLYINEDSSDLSSVCSTTGDNTSVSDLDLDSNEQCACEGCCQYRENEDSSSNSSNSSNASSNSSYVSSDSSSSSSNSSSESEDLSCDCEMCSRINY